MLRALFGQSAPLVCQVCGQETREYLQVRPPTQRLIGLGTDPGACEGFCRRHLLEAFSQRLNAFSGRLVVFHPELEQCQAHYSYAFTPLQDLRYAPQVYAVMEQALALVQGSCVCCGEPARFAFFGRGHLPRRRQHSLLGDTDLPMVEAITTAAQPYCPVCVLEEILPSLHSYQRFDNGLACPYGPAGVMMTLRM